MHVNRLPCSEDLQFGPVKLIVLSLRLCVRVGNASYRARLI